MTEAVILQKPVQWTGFYMITASAMEGLTTFTERKNIIFLLLFLKVSINQILASNKDFMVFSFFVWYFYFNLEKLPCWQARKTKNQVGLA